MSKIADDPKDESQQPKVTEKKAPPKEDPLQALEKKAKEFEEKYLRTYADLENYRKRVARERQEAVQATSERLLRELLEVKDHLELALEHAEEKSEAKKLREGVELTLKQLVNFLKKFGVEEVKALGENFDPSIHEAIHQEASVEYQPGSVVRVFQKGYLINGRLLRAARVAVAAEPQVATKESE